jgi:TPR repeat protein
VVKPSVTEPLPPPAPKPAGGLPEARVLDYMSREEIDGLVKRGQDLLAIGDISGGRLLLTRAAEAGDARASFALAGTYDSAVVATLGVVGAFPDAVKARAWYQKAAEQGSTEAARRLEQPHLRQR